MRLFLVRHPVPQVAEGVCYGRSDLPLRDACGREVRAVSAQLPAEAGIWSSPLLRCREFAALLGRPWRMDDRLSEMDFGRWEMQAWDAIPREQLDAWAERPLEYAGHGGENVRAVQARVAAALADLPTEDCIWITHGGVMKLAVAQMLGLPEAAWLPLRFDYATVTALDIRGGAARLLWHNSAHA